jgi:hypothetical protein
LHLREKLSNKTNDRRNGGNSEVIQGSWYSQACAVQSSAGTVNVEEHRKAVYDETCWRDADFCIRVKMTGWVCICFFFYFLSRNGVGEVQYFRRKEVMAYIGA